MIRLINKFLSQRSRVVYYWFDGYARLTVLMRSDEKFF